MRLSFSASIIFLYFFLIETSNCFLGHGNCETSLSKANGECDASGKIKTDSDLVSVDNAFKNNVGISETRVTMSRYHLGTENSRIYKERSSKKSTEHAVRGFMAGQTYPIQRRNAVPLNERRTLKSVDAPILETRRESSRNNYRRISRQSPNAFDAADSMPPQLERNQRRIKMEIRSSNDNINYNQEHTKGMNQEMMRNGDRHIGKRDVRRSTSLERVLENRRAADSRSSERSNERFAKELFADERSLRNGRYSQHRADTMRQANLERRVRFATEREANNDRQGNGRIFNGRQLDNHRRMSVESERNQRTEERRARELFYNIRSSRNERSLERSMNEMRQDDVLQRRARDSNNDTTQRNRQGTRRVHDVTRISSLFLRDRLTEQRSLINGERSGDRRIDSLRQARETNRLVNVNTQYEGDQRVSRRVISERVNDKHRESVRRSSLQSARENARSTELLSTEFIRQNDVRRMRLQVRNDIDRRVSQSERVTRRVANQRITSADKIMSDLDQRSETLRRQSIRRRTQDLERRVDGRVARRSIYNKQMSRGEDITIRYKDIRAEDQRRSERRVMPVESRKTEHFNMQRQEPKSTRVRNDYEERMLRRQLMKQERFQDEQRSLDSSDRFAEQRLAPSSARIVNDRTLSRRLDESRQIRNKLSANVERQGNRESRRVRLGARLLYEVSNTGRSIEIDNGYPEKSTSSDWLLSDPQMIQMILLSMITMRIMYDALDAKSKMKIKDRFGNTASMLKQKLL